MAVTINGDGLVDVGGTSTSQGRVRLAEDTDNGTNYIELTAPASVASNKTITLPDATTTLVGTDTTDTLTNKTLTTAALGSSTATTQTANDNSTKVATTAYADAVRDNPRILSLSNAATSANLSGIDSVVYPGTNGSNATLSTFSNVVTYKLYVFFNTGGSDGVRTLTIDRSNAYLNGSANAVLQANYTQLVIGRSSTTLAGAAPISANG